MLLINFLFVFKQKHGLDNMIRLILINSITVKTLDFKLSYVLFFKSVFYVLNFVVLL